MNELVLALNAFLIVGGEHVFESHLVTVKRIRDTLAHEQIDTINELNDALNVSKAYNTGRIKG